MIGYWLYELPMEGDAVLAGDSQAVSWPVRGGLLLLMGFLSIFHFYRGFTLHL